MYIINVQQLNKFYLLVFLALRIKKVYFNIPLY